MKIGYARVSSPEQSLEIQIEQLLDAGCEKIFSEKTSGATDQREELQAMLRFIRDGDQLYITRLDRLARSTYHLTTISEMLRRNNIDLIVTEQKIDTSTSTGRLLFNVLASIAEFELEIRKERQQEGIDKAKKKGVKFGRKAKLTPLQIEQMRDMRLNGATISECRKEFGISKASVYRLLRPDYEMLTT